MTLIKSKSKQAVGKNIATEMAAGRPQPQAIAIALDTQRRAGGGVAPKTKKRPRRKPGDFRDEMRMQNKMG